MSDLSNVLSTEDNAAAESLASYITTKSNQQANCIATNVAQPVLRSGTSGVQVNGSPSQWSNTNLWTTIGTAYSGDPAAKGPSTVELHCTDGSKVLIRVSDLDNIYDLREVTASKMKLKAKFPFFERKKETFVRFTHQTNANSEKCKRERQYEVKCSLSTLCKLLDIEYKSFSEAIIKDAIENG